MPTGYQIKEQDKLHFVTLQVVEWKYYAGEKGLLDIDTIMIQWKTYK